MGYVNLSFVLIFIYCLYSYIRAFEGIYYSLVLRFIRFVVMWR
jgi:hypothetical protein